MDARDRDIAVARFNADGTRDTTFGTNGVVTLDLSAGELVGTGYVADSAWGLAMYPDGRLVVTGAQKRMGGTDTDFAVVRLSADGVRDAAFGTNGVHARRQQPHATPRTATMLPDGSIVMAGYMTDGGVRSRCSSSSPPRARSTPPSAPWRGSSPRRCSRRSPRPTPRLQGTSFVTAGYGRNSAMENLDWLSLRISAPARSTPPTGTMGVARLDLAASTTTRAPRGLPTTASCSWAAAAPAETNSDGLSRCSRPTGQRDTTFGAQRARTFDFGGSSDFFWGVAVSPTRRV
jgi:uncharacterized delta-60 repeat protein